MPHIKITAVPAGHIPYEIREAWLDVTMYAKGYYGSSSGEENSDGYKAKFDLALAALEMQKGSIGALAAKIYRERFPNEKLIFFSSTCCIEVL